MASGFSAFRMIASRRFGQGLLSRQTSLAKGNSLVRYNSTPANGAKRDLGLGGIIGAFTFFAVCLLGIPLIVGVDVGNQARERALKAAAEE